VRILLSAVIASLTLASSLAEAQVETFVQSVRELAAAAQMAEPSRSTDIRAAASRMAIALVEWDRRVAALEARAVREMAGASDERAYQLHVELGVTYRTRGRTSEALRELDAAIAHRPDASDLQVLRALTLEAAGRSDEAGAAFRAAWVLDRQNPVKAYYVAERPGIAVAERDRARAVLTDIYRQLTFDTPQPLATPFVMLGAIPDNLSRAPVVADEVTHEGFALLSAGRYRDAVAALRRARPATGQQTDDSPLAHVARGQLAEAQNQVTDARREYQAALAGTLAGRSTLLVGIARLAQVEGDGAAAISAFTQAARLNPNDANIHKEFASALAAEGDPDAAFCELMAALLIDRRDPQVHAAIGQVSLDAGRHDEAVVAFTRALELNANGYEVRYALATAYTRLGNSAEAARHMEIFDRQRREALEKRRRDIENEVAQGAAGR
jgi:tetratricopeptide (TPR) repeat protein